MLHVFRPVSFSRTHQATCIAAPMAYVVEQTPSTSIPHGPKRFVSVVCFQIAPICISLHRQTLTGSTYANGTQNLCTAPMASSSTSTNQIISTSSTKAAPTTSAISPRKRKVNWPLRSFGIAWTMARRKRLATSSRTARREGFLSCRSHRNRCTSAVMTAAPAGRSRSD